MRSYYIRVVLKSNESVPIRDRKGHRDTERRGRQWNDMARSQGTPSIAGHQQKQGGRHGMVSPSGPLEGISSADTWILVFWSPELNFCDLIWQKFIVLCGTLLQQPQETITSMLRTITQGRHRQDWRERDGGREDREETERQSEGVCSVGVVTVNQQWLWKASLRRWSWDRDLEVVPGRKHVSERESGD